MTLEQSKVGQLTSPTKKGNQKCRKEFANFSRHVFVSICFSQQKYLNQNLDVTNTWKGLINGEFLSVGSDEKGSLIVCVKKLGGGFKICFRLPEFTWGFMI